MCVRKRFGIMHELVRTEKLKTIINIPIIIFGIKIFFYLAQQPPLGQGLLIHEVSRSHSTTHHSR